MPATDRTADAGSEQGKEVSILALLVRRPGLTRAQFREYYDTTHRDLFRRVTPPDVQDGIVRYVQNHAVDRTDARDESPYDCVTEMTFRDRSAMRAWGVWYASDDGAVLRDDELNFMDNSRRRLVISEPR